MKVIYINNYQHVISWTWRVAEKKKKRRGMQGREDNFAELKPKEY